MPDLVRVSYSGSGKSARANPIGMRPMQARAFEARAAQFLLMNLPHQSRRLEGGFDLTRYWVRSRPFRPGDPFARLRAQGPC